MIIFYHQTKTIIDFWCRRGLNLRFLIQPSENLLVKLTSTHNFLSSLTHTKDIFNIFIIPNKHMNKNLKQGKKNSTVSQHQLSIGQQWLMVGLWTDQPLN